MFPMECNCSAGLFLMKDMIMDRKAAKSFQTHVVG